MVAGAHFCLSLYTEKPLCASMYLKYTLPSDYMDLMYQKQLYSIRHAIAMLEGAVRK